MSDTQIVTKNYTEIEAYNFCEETGQLHREIMKHWFFLAQRLYTIKTQRLYEGQYGDYNLFLDAMEIPQQMASKLYRMYERLVVKLDVSAEKIQEVGNWTKLDAIMKVATTKERAEEAIEQAKLLPTRSKLREWVKEAVEDNYQPPCPHTRTYTLMICEDCGEKFKVNQTE